MKLITTVFLIIVSFTVTGQTIPNTFNDESWAVKVKQIDDFVDRFNNELNYIQNGVVVKNKLSSESRKKVLLSLFDAQKQHDRALVEEFVNYVVGFDYYIKFGLTEIESIVNVFSTYKNQKFDLDLFLKMESLPDGSSKWVIFNSSSSKYPWKEMASNPQKFINPSNHNLRFSGLGKYLNGGNDIKELFSDTFTLDEFSVFVHEIAQGNLVIGDIRNVRYSINIMDKYRLYVNYTDSDSKNSGWLITEIESIE
jgi:hypothetical protein